jgi:hypothetical protein
VPYHCFKCEEKSDDSKHNFYEELEQVFDHFSKNHMKILLAILMQNWGDRIFSNPHLGTAVYIRIVMIKVLEQ